MRNTKFALLLGAISGAINGLAFYPALAVYFELQKYRAWQVNINVFQIEINPVGLSILLAFLFALASYTVHKFWAKRVNSTIVLWQLVAIVAIAVPSIFLYSCEQIAQLYGATRIRIMRGEWGYLPTFIPDSNDLEFAIMLLCLAISVNFFYGLFVQKLSEFYKK